MTWARSDSTFSVKNPGDIANLLKDYFYSVAKPQFTSSNCVANLQPPTCCDFKNNTLRTISVISLSPSEVHDVPLLLDPNKAIGPDKILAKLLKVCAPPIFLSFCALFNKWLQLGKMPSSWKESNIVPILKGGTAKEVSNYIPISLLPLVSKVLERVQQSYRPHLSSASKDAFRVFKGQIHHGPVTSSPLQQRRKA